MKTKFQKLTALVKEFGTNIFMTMVRLLVQTMSCKCVPYQKTPNYSASAY